MNNKKVTWKQLGWLDDHGGRTKADVFMDDEGLYVLMGDGSGGDMKVYLPVEKPVDKGIGIP